jgi:shikimate kinase / 3-dehydroquinate synthase
MSERAAAPAVVLVGMSGAGKTTVGELLARRLGVGFLDTDAAIEASAGKPIAEIFIDDGEPAFRAMERAAVAAALAEHPGVLALGGGAVMAEQTRALLAGQRVVFLDVGLGTALRRVGLARDRPMLTINPRARLRQLMAERRPLYEQVATITVATDERTPDEVAAAVLAALDSEPTRIPVGDGYGVVVGPGLAGRLPGLLAGLLAGAERVALIHPVALKDRAAVLADDLRAADLRPHPIEVPDGEDAKTLAVAGACWDALAGAGFTRTDAIVGLGGGATTDLAGWVAAAWLRGVRVVHLPTTLLGMVDAAVGGKTGINIDAGKNLVGAFHPPAGVLCDLDALSTLPRRDHVAGLAEVVKCGFIADPAILELIEADPAAAADPAGPATRELVERAVRVKAGIVARDLRESGERAYLNYGHTLAHAIEKVEGYRWRHGDAVSVGLVFAAALGRLPGRLDGATADRHRAVLAALGLPTTYRGAGREELLAAMRVDKKARGSTLRFVVLDGLARPGILADPEPALLDAAFEEVSGEPTGE